jgi:hypothetical protein
MAYDVKARAGIRSRPWARKAMLIPSRPQETMTWRKPLDDLVKECGE